ncbi:MAG: efflux RND transporter periplasmic adaptor subunit [Candidatus Krumholzibacteriota bacterium]|nr:efflux RND transporter periplasmic adaptor subunit [Candidatus Krumholzibacteriota bacterium]
MRRLFLITAAVAIVFALPAIVGAQGMPPTLVATSTVTSMEFHDQITLVGKTEARSNSSVVSEVAGRVIRIDAEEGNPVRAGAVLVSIDPRRIRYQLDAKRAQVAQAKAAAELAEKNLARTENLLGRDLTSVGQMDRDIAESIRSAEFYKQLLAEQKQLELDLANCSVRSPFDGYTVRRLVDVGEGVNVGTPVFEVVDLLQVRVTVDLPERHFGQLDTDSDVLIRISGGGVPVTGKITGFAPSASGDTHTFPVIITVDNSDQRLGGGMLVRATLSLNKKFTSLAVHKDAIVRQGAQTLVYTIEEGKAVAVTVRIGSMSGDMVAISGDGVSEGMPVVVRGNERIFPGSPVRTADGEESGGEQTSSSDDDGKSDGDTAHND